MDGDQKTLTVGDILDQLVKSPAAQGPGPQVPQTPKPAPPPTSTPPVNLSQERGFSLPQLGKKEESSEPSVQTKPSASFPVSNQTLTPRLYIRTMADDLVRLKKGQTPTEVQIKSAPTVFSEGKKLEPQIQSPKIQQIQPTQQVVGQEVESQPEPGKGLVSEVSDLLKTLPVTGPFGGSTQSNAKIPPIKIPFFGSKPSSEPPLKASISLPSIPSPGQSVPEQSQPPFSGLPPHIHEEVEISDKDLLPAFPGAPMPKKIPKKQEEKVEYRAIARVVSSGMVTGILGTVILAVVVYFALTFFVFKKEPLSLNSTTPTPVDQTSGSDDKGLETIFKSTPLINFNVPTDNKTTARELQSFMDGQNIDKKEFKRINFQIPGLAPDQNPSFVDIMKSLAITPPPELKDIISKDNMVFLYGQEEVFGNEANLKRLVFIVEIKDSDKVQEVMNKWEATLADDFNEVFNIDPSKQASYTFLTNDHRGVTIKYKNFPLPDKSIDYTIITSLTGRHYLMITNSRESMFSPADKIKGL